VQELPKEREKGSLFCAPEKMSATVSKKRPVRIFASRERLLRRGKAMGEKIEYSNLSTGFKFEPSNFTLDPLTVAAYLKATGDKNNIYFDGLVPPMAIVALATRAMADKFVLLPGTVHVSQLLEFTGLVKTNETLTSYAEVNRKIVRGKFHMLNIGIHVVNSENKTVITGEVGFILPSNGE
jgi:hypothetical protein